MVRKLPLYALLSVYASGRKAVTFPNGNTTNDEYGLMNAAPSKRSVDTNGNAVSQEERVLDHYSLPTGEPTKRPNTNSKKNEEKATKIPTLEPTHEPSIRQAVAKTPPHSLIKSTPVKSFKSPSLSRIDQEAITTKPPTNKPTPILTNTPTAVPTEASVVLAAVFSSTIFPANTPDKTTLTTNTPTNVSTKPSVSPTIYSSPPTSVPSVFTAAATQTPTDDKLQSMSPTAMLVLVPPKKFATEFPTSSSSSGTSTLSTLNNNNNKSKSDSSSIISNLAEEEENQVETRISSLTQRIEPFKLRLQFTHQSSISFFDGSGQYLWLSHDSEEEIFVIDQTALLLEEWFLLLASQQQYGTAHVFLNTMDSAKADASFSDDGSSRYLQNVNSTLPNDKKVLSKVINLGGNVTFYKSLLFNKQSSNIPLFAKDGVCDYLNNHSEMLAKRLQIEGSYHGYSDIFEYLTGIFSSPLTQLESDEPPEVPPNTFKTKTNRTPQTKKIPTLNIFIVIMSFGFIMTLLAVYTFFSNRGANRRSSLLYPTARARAAAAAHTAASREPKRKNGSVSSKSRTAGDDCSKHSKSSRRSQKSRDSKSVRSREKRGRAIRTECYYDTVDDGTLCTMKTDGSLKKVRFRSVDSYYGGEPDLKEYEDERPDQVERVQNQTCGDTELADDQPPKEDESKIDEKCYEESVDSNDSCEGERNDTVTSLQNDLVSSDWEVI